MAITQEQLQKFNTWCRQKNVTLKCPACSGTNLTLAGISMGNDYSAGNVNIGSGIPVLLIACNNCACVTSFASQAIGI